MLVVTLILRYLQSRLASFANVEWPIWTYPQIAVATSQNCTILIDNITEQMVKP